MWNREVEFLKCHQLKRADILALTPEVLKEARKLGELLNDADRGK